MPLTRGHRWARDVILYAYMSTRIEGKDLVFEGFAKGIADSPYDGVADIRNANLITVPGEASVNFSLSAFSFPSYSGNFVSLTAVGDTATYSGTTIYNGVALTVASTANGLTAGTQYYAGSATSTTFKFYTSYLDALGITGGAAVDITSNGSNTFTTTVPHLPKHYAYDPSSTIANYYFVDDAQKVWALMKTNSQWVWLGNSTSSQGSGNGLVAYHGWLILFQGKNIQYLPTNFQTTSWTSSSFLLQANTEHPALVGYDDAIYYGDGSFIGSMYAIADYFLCSVDSADSGADTVTVGLTYGSIPVINAPIIFYGASLPGGISQGTVYYVASAPSTTFSQATFQVSTTLGGSALNITSSGTGNARNFEPALSSGSSVWNTTALSLPAYETVNCLAELGTDLLIGGTTNRVYPWDRLSNSNRVPILISENGVQKMVTINTNTYIFAGNRGRIYKTNGSQAQLYKKIPDHLTGVIEPYITWTAVGYNRNQLYFSFSVTQNDGTAVATTGGLWAIDIDVDALRMTNLPSYGTNAGYISLFIPIQSVTDTSNGFGFYAGWNNGSGTYGMDKTTSTPYSSYETYIDTEIVNLGRKLTQKTFENIEFLLASPLASGEGVKVYYRTNLAANFVACSTLYESTTAGTLSDVYIPNFENVQWIQFRVYLKSTSSNPSYARLKELRLR